MIFKEISYCPAQAKGMRKVADFSLQDDREEENMGGERKHLGTEMWSCEPRAGLLKCFC